MTDKHPQTRTALITGANRGIGLATARGLKAEGYRILGTARQPDQAQELAEIADRIYEFDAADPAASARLLDRLSADKEQVDVLINNAGVALDKWQSGLSVNREVLEQTMAVNLFAPIQLCQLLLPGMIERGYGRVVNLSSELGSLNTMEMGSTLAYRSSKTALNSVTKLLSLEIKEDVDVLVNAVCPGWVATELGGEDAPLTPEQGADTVIWAATLPSGSPTGALFRERDHYPW